nr:MAG TPA: hypothetical protein [Caudoviricetes sp.]
MRRDYPRVSSPMFPERHQFPTPMCHSHRSSPLTSAQTSVVPKKHHSITRLMIAASKCFHVFDAASKAGNISLLHPCAALLMYDKLLRSLNQGHEGKTPFNFQTPIG